MIVATSGLSFINYNRIISFSNSPYSVQSSLAYRDPANDYSRLIKALYIKDENIAISLIFDNGNKWTDLATIHFS